MANPDFTDTRGYDPYNHTGKRMRKKQFVNDVATAILGDKILIMDRPKLDFLRQEMKVLAPEPRFTQWWSV